MSSSEGSRRDLSVLSHLAKVIPDTLVCRGVTRRQLFNGGMNDDRVVVELDGHLLGSRRWINLVNGFQVPPLSFLIRRENALFVSPTKRINTFGVPYTTITIVLYNDSTLLLHEIYTYFGGRAFVKHQKLNMSDSNVQSGRAELALLRKDGGDAMLTDENSSTYKELRRMAETLVAPIAFDRLVVEGVLQKKGSWYAILDWDRLPESARVRIKAVRPTNLVKFRKPSKKLRKFLRRGY